MNELTFVSSVLFVIPAVYIFHKFYYLNKSINQYARQIQSLNEHSEVSESQSKSNLTLIHCQKCRTESYIDHPKVVSNS
jgi:hypothetical protein